MMHDPADILYKQISGEPLTDAEAEALREWAAQSPHRQAVIDELNHEASLRSALAQVYETDTEALWQKVQKHGRKARRSWMRYAAAAALFLLTATGAYVITKQRQTPAITIRHDVQPGSNKAILTLENGEQIPLDSAATRTLRPGIKQDGSQIEYDAHHSATISYNTLSTPRGGQFNIILPDGTKVWLNAASQLRYPTAFTGRNRKVEIKGEAYFDVAKDSRRPFLVSINNATDVQVLGTEFNVNAYKDESGIRTTLLQGAIRITTGQQQEVLQPGQQAYIAENGTLRIATSVNTAQVIAWKNGVFDINDMRVDAVMRQLARWYDVEVVYEKGIPDITFYGHIQRHLQLSQVLKILEKMDVHCRIEEGRKLIVQ